MSKPSHVFGRTRPSANHEHQLHVPSSPQERDTHFRPLPHPSGKAPFHLDLASVIPKAQYDAIKKSGKLVFHLNGDMGGIQYAVPQELVAKGMEADSRKSSHPEDSPAFLYVVGDCVYFNGETKEYYTQFYQPYEFYPAPIFAVPGNHDGENLPGQSTLDGFVRNFCSKHPVRLPEAGDSERTTMVQPNVYWTLLTPFVSIIGLYSNVPPGGDIREPQSKWLAEQLRTLPKDLPILVALHHPIYSADDHHSGSTHMKGILEAAAASAGRHPEMVLAGHVHNYQRLTKKLAGGAEVPYLVVGAGGYHNLHHVQKVDGEPMVTPVVFKGTDEDPVMLETYSDDHHGFLRVEISKTIITGRYYTVPRPQEPYSKANRLLDYFEFDWKKRKYIPNTLGPDIKSRKAKVKKSA